MNLSDNNCPEISVCLYVNCALLGRVYSCMEGRTYLRWSNIPSFHTIAILLHAIQPLFCSNISHGKIILEICHVVLHRDENALFELVCRLMFVDGDWKMMGRERNFFLVNIPFFSRLFIRISYSHDMFAS